MFENKIFSMYKIIYLYTVTIITQLWNPFFRPTTFYIRNLVVLHKEPKVVKNLSDELCNLVDRKTPVVVTVCNFKRLHMYVCMYVCISGVFIWLLLINRFIRFKVPIVPKVQRFLEIDKDKIEIYPACY
jgi:hypothetical protein